MGLTQNLVIATKVRGRCEGPNLKDYRGHIMAAVGIFETIDKTISIYTRRIGLTSRPRSQTMRA
jgi:hypothetical protein